jgi:acetoin utilization deacetylase AcuC-like enzyme
MKTIYSPECLSYHSPGHPESPERIRATAEYLAKKGYSFVQPQSCSEADVLRVHSEEMVANVRMGTFFDGDTPALPGIYDYALLSAGGAMLALDSAFEGETAISLMRPPGHHATRDRVMGFCYFNNVAIAVAGHIATHTTEKAAILDIDCHHGNGTEDIFMSHDSVQYVSLHQSPLYPGTGLLSQGNVVNFPLFPGTPESDYLNTLEQACQKIAEFNPSILGISAGFDTFEEDPLTQLNLVVETYRKIGSRIAGLEIPTFIVMEGGYSSRLPECVFEFLSGLEG